MNDADLLRRAADAVEKNAHGCIDCGHATDEHTAGALYTGCVHQGCDCPEITRDVVPTLAGPLAEWLRSAAVDAEQVGADRHAVAVALVILGAA